MSAAHRGSRSGGPTPTATAPAPEALTGGLSKKGLSAGTVGLIGAVVIGISCIAPAYTLTAALGPTVSEVGFQVPAIILLGFIPMLLVAFGYRELNRTMPDSGTSFGSRSGSRTWMIESRAPTSLPSEVDGMRIAAGDAWSASCLRTSALGATR